MEDIKEVLKLRKEDEESVSVLDVFLQIEEMLGIDESLRFKREFCHTETVYRILTLYGYVYLDSPLDDSEIFADGHIQYITGYMPGRGSVFVRPACPDCEHSNELRGWDEV